MGQGEKMGRERGRGTESEGEGERGRKREGEGGGGGREREEEGEGERERKKGAFVSMLQVCTQRCASRLLFEVTFPLVLESPTSKMIQSTSLPTPYKHFTKLEQEHLGVRPERVHNYTCTYKQT